MNDVASIRAVIAPPGRAFVNMIARVVKVVFATSTLSRARIQQASPQTLQMDHSAHKFFHLFPMG
jgi:hypothetical protein